MNGDVMLAFIKLKKIIEELNDNIKEFVIANISFNLFYAIIFYLVAFDICSMISVHVNVKLGLILIFLISLLIPFLLFTQLACVGIGKDELLIIHLKRFKFKTKKVYNFPIDKIRNITVRKFLLSVSFKISFISEDGVLEKKKYKFSTFAIGKPEIKHYANKVYEKLVEIQKVIDKGDF